MIYLTRYRVFVLALKGILQQLHELIEANVPRDRELLPAIFVRAFEMNVAVKVLFAAVEHVDRLNGRDPLSLGLLIICPQGERPKNNNVKEPVNRGHCLFGVFFLSYLMALMISKEKLPGISLTMDWRRSMPNS